MGVPLPLWVVCEKLLKLYGEIYFILLFYKNWYTSSLYLGAWVNRASENCQFEVVDGLRVLN
jgi:hypothetical protein